MRLKSNIRIITTTAVLAAGVGDPGGSAAGANPHGPTSPRQTQQSSVPARHRIRETTGMAWRNIEID